MTTLDKINIVFIGHVDHGKSTLMGRLFYDAGAIDPHLIEKYRKEASNIGKATFEFAWATDIDPEERERGLTIAIRHRNFQTKTKNVYLIDAPGHADFIKNMIVGTSEADVAVLVVDVDDGIKPQTKEHALLAKTLGIEQMVVAVNKMDTVLYSKDPVESLKEDLLKMLTGYGFSSEEIIFVPVSGLNGDNVVHRSKSMKWYNGPTFLETLDNIQVTSKQLDKPLRLPIDEIYTVKGIGNVFAGVILYGKIQVGDEVISAPSGIRSKVHSIEIYHKSFQEAVAGDDVGVVLRGETTKDIRRYEIIGSMDVPPTITKKFKARIVILNHPTAIYPGYSPQLHISTQMEMGIFEKLLSTIDPKTGDVKEEEPECLRTGDIADVVITTNVPVVLEDTSVFPRMSHFAIRDMSITVGAGRCLDVKLD